MRPKLLFPTSALLIFMSGSQVLASPVVVACGPGQHSIVRTSYLRSEPVTRVSCVGNRFETTRPAGYYEQRYGYHRRHRSWGKSALIIGGSAATGAGVGGLVGGRKGALIGAALGGGVGSLYEGKHRR